MFSEKNGEELLFAGLPVEAHKTMFDDALIMMEENRRQKTQQFLLMRLAYSVDYAVCVLCTHRILNTNRKPSTNCLTGQHNEILILCILYVQTCT